MPEIGRGLNLLSNKARQEVRVALISPQVIAAKNQVRKAQAPLGIASLGAALEANGYTNLLLIDAVLDGYDNVITLEDNPLFIKFGLSDEDIVNKLRAFNPTIVGVSMLFSSVAECGFSISRSVKKAFPDVPIIFGGIHASFMHKKIMEEIPSVDFVLCGESDFTFVEFVEKLSTKQDYTDIPGLVWRNGSQVMVNHKASFIPDLDQLPFPAWHRIDMEKYFEISMPHNPFVKSGRVGCIMTQRGCPQRCYFCSSADYFGHKFRGLSSKRTIEMVKYLVDTFKIEELQIMDDTFTSNPKRVIEICEGIKKYNLRISLPNAIRADVPKDRERRLKMFKAMREAGVVQIGMSVEHGDQEFLDKVIEKRLDLNDVIVSCDIAHEAGLMVHANFMMGFPFETAELRQRTIDFAKNLDADSFSVSLASPLPGTRLWDIVEKNNLFMDAFDVNRMLYVYVNIKPHDISPEDLYNLVDRFNRELNESAQIKRPETIEKYKLFKGKSGSGDRKYHFAENKLK